MPVVAGISGPAKKILSAVGYREISLYVIVHTFMHCLPPITVSRGDIRIRKTTPRFVESESRY